MSPGEAQSAGLCQIMWKGNAILGISLAGLGAIVSFETFGYNIRFGAFGLLTSGFLAGALAVIFGTSAAIGSIWRIRRIPAVTHCQNSRGFEHRKFAETIRD
jgi:hypothetical protein